MSILNNNTLIKFGKLKGLPHICLIDTTNQKYRQWVLNTRPKSLNSHFAKTQTWLKRYLATQPIISPERKGEAFDLSLEEYDAMGSNLLEDLTVDEIRSYLAMREREPDYIHADNRLDPYEYKK